MSHKNDTGNKIKIDELVELLRHERGTKYINLRFSK